MPAQTDAPYSAVAASGPPVEPVPPPAPIYTRCKRLMKPVHYPADDENDDERDGATSAAGIPRPSLGLQRAESLSGNVLVPLDNTPDTNVNSEGGDPDQATRAYWLQRKIATLSGGGSVRIGYVLRRLEDDDDDDNADDCYEDHKGAKHSAEETPHESSTNHNAAVRRSVQWEVTPKPPSSIGEEPSYEMVAVRMYGRSGQAPHKRGEDIASSQLLAEFGPDYHHVLGTVEVLADERFVYVIVPYCGDGDLLSLVEGTGRLDEPTARHFFQQILKAIGLFQTAGLCHGALTPGHVLLRGSDCYISGKGHALRVPYNDSGDDDTIVDIGAKSATIRRLIAPRGQYSSQPQYTDPALLASRDGFDGYGADLWSAGVILFHMIFGFAPFEWAGADDPRFVTISVKGRLDEFVAKWSEDDSKGRSISKEAIDLLQSMLKADPKDRLILADILKHPWVISTDTKKPECLVSSASSLIRRASLGV